MRATKSNAVSAEIGLSSVEQLLTAGDVQMAKLALELFSPTLARLVDDAQAERLEAAVARVLEEDIEPSGPKFAR